MTTGIRWTFEFLHWHYESYSKLTIWVLNFKFETIIRRNRCWEVELEEEVGIIPLAIAQFCGASLNQNPEDNLIKFETESQADLFAMWMRAWKIRGVNSVAYDDIPF